MTTTGERPLPTDADRRFFDANGYVVVRGLVAPERCRAVVEAIHAFLGIAPGDRETWYRPPVTPRGFVELYHHASMWEIRQDPRVYQVFRELWREERLWVSLDRVGFNPPASPAHPEFEDQSFIHWDADTSQCRSRSACRESSTSPTPPSTRVAGRACRGSTAASRIGSPPSPPTATPATRTS